MPGPLPGPLTHPKTRWVPVDWAELPGWSDDPVHEAWSALMANCQRPNLAIAPLCSELRRLFPSIQMPVVYAQHRPSSLQQVRMRDYQAVCEAVLRGDADAADAAGLAHVQHVREAIVHSLTGAGTVG